MKLCTTVQHIFLRDVIFICCICKRAHILHAICYNYSTFNASQIEMIQRKENEQTKSKYNTKTKTTTRERKKIFTLPRKLICNCWKVIDSLLSVLMFVYVQTVTLFILTSERIAWTNISFVSKFTMGKNRRHEIIVKRNGKFSIS